MADNQMEKISDRFKKARIYLGLKQADFAKRANIKQSQVSEIESDKRNITPAILIALEDTFNLNRKWIESGEGEMFKKKNITDEPRFMRVPGFSEIVGSKGLKEKLKSNEFEVNEPDVREMYVDLKTKLLKSYEDNIELLREVSRLKDTIIHLKDEIFELSK